MSFIAAVPSTLLLLLLTTSAVSSLNCENPLFVDDVEYHRFLESYSFEYGTQPGTTQNTNEALASLCNATTESRSLGYANCGGAAWYVAVWNLTTGTSPNPCYASYTTITSSSGQLSPGQTPSMTLTTADGNLTLTVQFSCDENRSPSFSMNKEQTIMSVQTKSVCPAPGTGSQSGNDDNDGGGGDIGAGVIIGIVVGCVALVAVVAAIIAIALHSRPTTEPHLSTEGGEDPSCRNEPTSPTQEPVESRKMMAGAAKV